MRRRTEREEIESYRETAQGRGVDAGGVGAECDLYQPGETTGHGGGSVGGLGATVCLRRGQLVNVGRFIAPVFCLGPVWRGLAVRGCYAIVRLRLDLT
jgi:hypothetical protein